MKQFTSPPQMERPHPLEYRNASSSKFPEPVEVEDDQSVNDADDDGDAEGEYVSEEFQLDDEKSRLEKLFLQLSREFVFLRGHDVVIEGNSKIDASVILSEAEVLKMATTLPEIIQAADVVNKRLRSLGLFDSVDINLLSGPPGLPGTTKVVIEVVEKKSIVYRDLGVFAKPQVNHCYVVKHAEHDRYKTGLQFRFSSAP